jgi:hypothetical protein
VRLTSKYSRVAMPWLVWCPHFSSDADKHQILDVMRELLETQDYTDMGNGDAALTCPQCRKLFILPEGWFGGAADGSGHRLAYWSQAIWDKADPLWKSNALVTTPNLEQLLR